MTRFTHNDLAFALTPSGEHWDLTRLAADGTPATGGTGLFPGLPPDEALRRAQALVRTICPVGIRLVGPDVAHPALVGDLHIVGPNVAHPNFIHWDTDSSSLHSD